MSEFCDIEELDEIQMNEFDEISDDMLEELSIEDLCDIDSCENIQDIAIDSVLSEMSLDELYSLRDTITDTDEESDQKVLKLR